MRHSDAEFDTSDTEMDYLSRRQTPARHHEELGLARRGLEGDRSEMDDAHDVGDIYMRCQG